MPVAPDQAHMLAELAVACRPHGARRWDRVGIVRAIEKVAHLALDDVALAVFRAAGDRDLDTPGAIGNTRAPCWRERNLDRPTPLAPRPAAAHCASCGKPTREECATGRLPGDDHEFLPVGATRGTGRPPDAARQIAVDLKARIRPLGDRPTTEETT